MGLEMAARRMDQRPDDMIRIVPRGAVVTLAALVLIAVGLGGCAVGGATSSAFVDPAKYDLYDCKQLFTAHKTVSERVSELERLMAKAETGAAGTLISGLAYQTDFATARGQRDLIEENLRRSNCGAVPSQADKAKGPISRSALY